MRSLLLWEIDRVRDASARGVTVEVRTLRGLWYELIKPALARLGRLEECNWAAKLSDYLVELVERGHTSYEELRIIDGSRLRHGPGERIAVLDSVPVVRVHHPHIILFTEKDTIYGVLDGLSTMYGISVVSGSGQPSYAASENLLREIVEHPNFVPGSQIQLLALTDFDPAGYFIAQAQWRQLCKVAEVFAPARKVNGVAFTRLGLKPDQLTAEELAKNAYPPSDKGLELWMLQTGGIDGEPLGLELDAHPLLVHCACLKGKRIQVVLQFQRDQSLQRNRESSVGDPR